MKGGRTVDAPEPQRPPVIWLTGFGPFGRHARNPAEELVRYWTEQQDLCVTLDAVLPHWRPATVSATIRAAVLSVDEPGARSTADALRAAAPSHALPDAVVHLGLAEAATRLRFELVAHNELAMRIADNAGRQVTHGPVVPGGPARLATTACDKLLHAAQALGWGDLSGDAGRYVCNETYYRTLHAIAALDLRDAHGRALPTLFVHVPPTQPSHMEALADRIGRIMALTIHRPMLHVAAALIEDRHGRMLACRRGDEMAYPGFWELPGGKIELDESPICAVRRELREELALDDLGDAEPFSVTEHDYPEYRVVLHVFRWRLHTDQQPTLLVHAECRWVEPSAARELGWLLGNQPVVQAWSTCQRPRPGNPAS